MSVSAPTHEFGLFEKKGDEQKTVYWRENSEYWDPPLIRDYTEDYWKPTIAHWRREGSSSPVRMIKGSPWRDPTSYTRWVQKLHGIVGGNQTRQTGFIKEVRNNIPLPIGAEVFYPRIYPSGLGRAPIQSDIRNQAETECLIKIGNRKTDLGTALVESVKTLGMVAETSSSLFRAFIAFKRGNWGAIPGHLGMSRRDIIDGGWANQFLKWKFGWLPLMDDIHGGIELLKQKLEPAQFIHAERTIHDNVTLPEFQSYGGFRTSGSAKSRTTVRLTGRLSDVTLREMNQANVINPASVIWESVPFSFLIDWAMPIGNWLEGISATAGLDFVGGSLSHTAEGSASCTLPKPDGWEGTETRWSSEFFSFERIAYGGWPKPLPYAVQNPFKIGRAATALSLFRQML